MTILPKDHVKELFTQETFQQQIILIVFMLFEVVYGRTFFQKFFFLIEKEVLPELNLGYVPYHYGPFSRTLDKILRMLQKENFVTEDVCFNGTRVVQRTFTLTSLGQEHAKLSLQKIDLQVFRKITQYVNEFKTATPSQILKYFYEEYPKMTVNSVLLQQDELRTTASR